MLYESIEHADHTVVRFENKISFENESGAWGILRMLFYQTNREALSVFCSARALKKWGETLDYVVVPQSLPACSPTEQSTVKASLFVESRFLLGRTVL